MSDLLRHLVSLFFVYFPALSLIASLTGSGKPEFVQD
jgi:hypothetical protein